MRLIAFATATPVPSIPMVMVPALTAPMKFSRNTPALAAPNWIATAQALEVPFRSTSQCSTRKLSAAVRSRHGPCAEVAMLFRNTQSTKLQFAPAAPLNTMPFVEVLAVALNVTAQPMKAFLGVAIIDMKVRAVTGIMLMPTNVVSAAVFAMAVPASVEVQLTLVFRAYVFLFGAILVSGCAPTNASPALDRATCEAEVCVPGSIITTSPLSAVAFEMACAGVRSARRGSLPSLPSEATYDLPPAV